MLLLLLDEMENSVGFSCWVVGEYSWVYVGFEVIKGMVGFDVGCGFRV